MSSSRYTALWLVLLLCLGVRGRAQESSLTLRQAIDQALGSSSEAAVAHADSKAVTASLRMAHIQLLPALNFTEDISRGNDPVYAFGTRLRQQQFTQANFALNALNRPSPIGNFSTRLSGSWTAFDSLKTQKEIRRTRLLQKSSEYTSQQSDQKVVLDVVHAYQSVLFAQRKIDVAKHNMETANALFDSAKDHVKAGLAVESDRMLAQVNLASHKQELISAEGDLEIAWAELQTAMGSDKFTTSELQPLQPHTFPCLPLEQELTTASKMRPEMLALRQAQSAESIAVGIAKADFGPRVNTYGNWETDRTSFAGSGGNNWVAGVQISIDLLPVGKRVHLEAENVEKEKIDARVRSATQQVALAVRRAHIQQQTALLTLQTAEASMKQSKESLSILQNRYNAGLATITDLLHAEDAERQSQASYWQAVYRNSVAYAELLYSMGTLTPDAAEVLQ